jgi:hypothetical protein
MVGWGGRNRPAADLQSVRRTIEATRVLLVRKQYYFRQTPEGLLAWDVDRLVTLSSTLRRRQVPLAQIRELDQPCFGEDEPPTWHSLLSHLELIDAADLSYPIILAADGSVMDGMHRVTKAMREGRNTIEAVQFPADPEPDYVGRSPEDLPY